MPAKTTTGLQNSHDSRLFASPVALAFVRRAVAAGRSVAEARKRYLNFISKPAQRAPSKAA